MPAQQNQRTFADFGLPALVAVSADEIPPVNCCNCNEETESPTCIDGDDWCDDCRDDNFVTCEHCNEYVDSAHFLGGIDNEGCYCQSCFDRLFVSCNHCDCTICAGDAREGGGDRYCEDCFYDIYTICEGCGDAVPSDDAYYHERSGCSYCSSCHRDDGDYSAKSFRPGSNSYARTGSERTFGVELETSACDDYMDAEDRFHFGAKDDSSISGKEFVSAVLTGDAGLDAVEAFCSYAESSNWSVNSRCGFHAHFGVSDLSVEQLKSVAYAYKMNSEVWGSFVSESRRDNRFCGPVQWGKRDLENCAAKDAFAAFARYRDRYCWFNIASYGVHTTFEVRLHGGTINSRAVCNWVVLNLRFIEAVKDMTLGQIDAKFSGRTGQAAFRAFAGCIGDRGLIDYYVGIAGDNGTEYYNPLLLVAA